MIFQPNGTFTLCRSYAIANTYIGFLVILCAECIFVLRSIAVWERKRLVMALQFSSIIVYTVLVIMCFKQYSSASGECRIFGFVEYLDTKTSTPLIVVYCLAIVAQLQILLLVLYRAVKSRGDRGIGNRLMLGLVRDNLLYFVCSFPLNLGMILAIIFLPSPAAHLISEFSTILQAVLVTRMHRDFWRSDRASCGVDTDVSLTTWMVATPDLVASAAWNLPTVNLNDNRADFQTAYDRHDHTIDGPLSST
ncbi:hypothetical protein DEU56DRAFT_798533 [Suillus clintonianus]|uniref:uncharacterized protein n=1 Tax=Suillus clintonianus TaxID=1904413 RepID=UPI001B87081B|nr:uncharacterized protein DEU56DRAFT_798533 [Suillus clintonianus]KAG2140083.1 hypothetical protein DEU56DRAFT_798533 [Suillus clintonianus]